MAQRNMHGSVDDYMDERGRKTFENFGKLGARSADSQTRNLISEYIQRLADNGYEISEDFFKSVSGKDDAGFANDDPNKIGNTEITAMANAMVELDQMMTDGLMSADRYAEVMKQLTSPEMIESFAAGGGDKWSLLMDDIDKMKNGLEDGTITQEEIDANKAANETAFTIGLRPVVNDPEDYRQSFGERNPEYGDTSARVTEDEFLKKLDDMKKAGLIDDEMYDNARLANREYVDGYTGGANSIVYLAMNDLLAMYENGQIQPGDQLINDIVSRDFITCMSSDEDIAKTLSELDTNMYKMDAGLDVNSGRAGDEKGADEKTEDKGSGGKGDTAAEKDKSGREDGRHSVSFTDDELATLHEGMYNDYFDSLDMSDDDVNDFLDTLEEYREKKGDMSITDEQREMIDKIDEIDRLIKGIDIGHIGVSCSDEPDPDTGHYSYSFTDDHGKDEMPRGFDPSCVDSLNAAMQLIDGTYDPSESSKENESEQNEGAENESEQNEDEQNESEQTSSGRSGEENDYDADFTLEDIEILGQKSPSELADEKLALAQRMWRGDFGNGVETRIAAFEEMGLSEADYREIQDITNMGYEWVMNATPEDYNNAFNPGSPSLEEQDAAFKAQQAEAAARIMTYEGAGDLSDDYQALIDAYNAQHEGSEIEAGNAEEIYDNAYAAYGNLSDEEKAGISEEITAEADSNLNLEEMVAGGDFEEEQTATSSDRAGTEDEAEDSDDYAYDAGSTGGGTRPEREGGPNREFSQVEYC